MIKRETTLPGLWENSKLTCEIGKSQQKNRDRRNTSNIWRYSDWKKIVKEIESTKPRNQQNREKQKHGHMIFYLKGKWRSRREPEIKLHHIQK